MKYIFEIKHSFSLVFATSVQVKMKKYLKKKNQLRYLKLLAQKLNFSIEINDKYSEFKIGYTAQIGLQKHLLLKKLCRKYMLIVIFTEKKLLERFTKKNCRKQFKKNFGQKK